MASLKTLLVCGAVAVVLLGAGYLYVSGLKGERDAALKETGKLSATVKAQETTITILTDNRAQVDELLKEWRQTREDITAERQEKREATKEARNNDASFAGWADSDLPVSVRSGGLLGKAGKHSDSPAGAAFSPGRADGANARPGMARQEKR